MAGRNITSLSVSLIARTGQFTKGLAKARKSIVRTARAMKSAATSAVGLGSAFLAAAAGGGLALLVKQSFALIDSQTKVAQKLGLTTQALVGLQHAAGQSGIDVRGLNTGLQRMVRRIADASAGNKQLAKTFKRLGLDARELNRLTADEAFLKIADAMEKIGLQGDVVQKTFKIFDQEGVGLTNLFKLGSSGIRELIQEAKVLGLTFSDIESNKIVAANDAFARLRGVIRGAANVLAIKLAPIVEFATNRLVELVKEAGGMRTIVGAAFARAIDLGNTFASILQGTTVVWQSMKAVGASALALIIKGLSLAISAAGKLIGLFSDTNGLTLTNFAQDLSNFAEGLQQTRDAALKKAGENFDALGRDTFARDFESGLDQIFKDADARARAAATAFDPKRPDVDTSSTGARVQKVQDPELKIVMERMLRVLETGGVSLGLG